MTTGELGRYLVVAVLAMAPAAGHPKEPILRVPLADLRMAATADARMTLKYLAGCALEERTVLTASVDGVAYEFPGDIGLAPHWISRAMSVAEQHWVSACMLARTNRLGVTVPISMRSYFASSHPRLRVSGTEARDFSLREATFFGNLFADEPVSYVCGPPLTAALRRALEARRRLCSLPGPVDGGPPLTACLMRHVGECSSAAFDQGGETYREAISVYLSSRAPAEATR